MSEISKAIKYWRTKRNLTQKELGDMVNIDENAISHFENNRRVPSVGLLIKMAEALKVKPDKLMTPQREIFLEDRTDIIITDFMFLENHVYFCGRRFSKNGTFINYRFNHNGEEFELAIDRKLLSLNRHDDIKEDNHIKYESIFQLPNWFQDLMQISFEKLFRLQKEFQIEMNIYQIIIYSLLKHKDLFSSTLSVAREQGKILKELRENNRLISSKQEVISTLAETSNNLLNIKLVEKTYYEIKYEY